MSRAAASRLWPARCHVAPARKSMARGGMPAVMRAYPIRCSTGPMRCSTRPSSTMRCRRRRSSRSWPLPSSPTPRSARVGWRPSARRCNATPHRRATACAASCCARTRRVFSTACSARTKASPTASGRGPCRRRHRHLAGTPAVARALSMRAWIAASTTCCSDARSTPRWRRAWHRAGRRRWRSPMGGC